MNQEIASSREQVGMLDDRLKQVERSLRGYLLRRRQTILEELAEIEMLLDLRRTKPTTHTPSCTHGGARPDG
jgi:CHASE3 domain sensor protein